MVIVLALALTLSGTGGALLWIYGNPDQLPIAMMVVMGGTSFLLLALCGFFFWRSGQIQGRPIPRAMRDLRGKMIAAIGLLLFWYLVGGLLGVFLLDNFIGWDHLPIILSVLIGLGLVPLGDAFHRPMFFLWGFLIVTMAVLLLITAPGWHAFRAQVQGAWIMLVLWTLTLDQFKWLQNQVTENAA